jgi:hypothetical protein
MTAKNIRLMQQLAYEGGPEFNGHLLGPWMHPEDDLPSIGDPFAATIELSVGTVTLADYWAAIYHNTRAVIANYPDVYDIEAQRDEIYKGIRASSLDGSIGLGDVDRSGYIHFESLPLVGPLRVAPGWWQIDEGRAVCIIQRGEIDSYLVWNVVLRDPQTINGVTLPRLVSPTNAMMTVTPDGDVKVHDDYYLRAPQTQLLLLVDFQICSVAMSIMQTDPKVVERTERNQAKKKPRKTKKRTPIYSSMATIALPGLRYERATGSWSAKRSTGVAWHMVRGHYRLLKSDRYVNKQGQKVWVKPHSKGDLRRGSARKRYIPALETT